MKKFYLLISALACAAGTWAQTVASELPFELSNNSEKHYYAIKSGRGDARWYTLTGDNKIHLDAYTGADNQLWYFMQVTNGGNNYLQLYPKTQEGKAMSYQNTSDGGNKIVAQTPGTSGYTCTWTLYNLGETNKFGLKTSDNVTYLSNYGGVSNNMGLYSGDPTTDSGTALYIYEPGVSITLTDDIGNNFSCQAVKDVRAENLAVGCATLSNVVKTGSGYTANVTFPLTVSSATTERPVMINSYTDANLKWYAAGSDIKVKKGNVAESTNLATYLWAIYPIVDNGNIRFNIKNVATNTYVTSTSDANNHDQGRVTLTNTGTNLFWNGAEFQLPTGKFLSVNSSNTTNEQYVGTWSAHKGTKLTFPTINYNVTIGGAEAATLYTPVAVQIPDGVTAKYPASVDLEGTLVYNTLSEVIPAGAPTVAG